MADYLSKRGANIAPSYAAIADLPASTQAGDLVFVGGQLGIAVDASTFNTCDKTDISVPPNWGSAAQQAKIQSSDLEDYDYFGKRVAISGDTVVVGAYGEDAGGSDAGAAYVFTRSGTSWSQQAKLTASDAAAGDYFGTDVDISGDTVVVGAERQDTGGTYAGAAYVFTRSGTSWSQQAKLQASDRETYDYFGWQVGISGDTIVAGAYGEDTGGAQAGAAYIFTRSGTSWSQQAKLTASDAAAGKYFGHRVSISGNTVAIGTPELGDGVADGAVHIFTRSGTSWSQQAKLEASNAGSNDQFGDAVSISGDTVVVGAMYEDTGGDNYGSAYVFTRSGTSWSQQAQLQSSNIGASDYFGDGVAITGDTIIVGASFEDTGASAAGSAYVFTRSGTSWTEVKQIQASDPSANAYFGESVAIDANGTGVVGQPKYNNGAAYVFVAP